MPLLNQLRELSEPGNPDGVCALSSAVTAYALMNGPESLQSGKIQLPLRSKDEVCEVDPTAVGVNRGPTRELDVTKLEDGEEGVWKWDEGEGTEREAGRSMLEWLSGSAPSGVYVCCIDDPGEDDEHFFNIAKTEDGKVYLVDTSVQNFTKLKGVEDLELQVIAQKQGSDSEDLSESEEESEHEVVGEEQSREGLSNPKEEVISKGKEIQSPKARQDTFLNVYCSGEMRLDFCGPLHPKCAEELRANLKRSLREDYQRTETTQSTKRKVTIN